MWMRGKNKNSNTKNILRSFPQEILFLISVANIFLALVVDCMTAFSEQRFYVIMTSLLQVKLHTSRLTYCRIHTRMCWVTTSMYVSFTKYFEGWRKINMLIFQINGCIWRLWSQCVYIGRNLSNWCSFDNKLHLFWMYHCLILEFHANFLIKVTKLLRKQPVMPTDLQTHDRYFILKGKSLPSDKS